MFISLKKVSTGRQKRNPGFDRETRDFLKVTNNCNFVSGHARQLVLVSSPRFLSPGHLHDAEIDQTVKNRVEGL